MGPEVNQDTTPTKMMVRKVDSLICGMTIKIGGGCLRWIVSFRGVGALLRTLHLRNPLILFGKSFHKHLVHAAFSLATLDPPPPGGLDPWQEAWAWVLARSSGKLLGNALRWPGFFGSLEVPRWAGWAQDPRSPYFFNMIFHARVDGSFRPSHHLCAGGGGTW